MDAESIKRCEVSEVNKDAENEDLVARDGVEEVFVDGKEVDDDVGVVVMTWRRLLFERGNE